MKKIVLTFGLISGAMLAVFMFSTIPFIDKIGGSDRGMIIGFTGMILAFLLVFFGIRSYRENVGNGYITFGKAFIVGILIMLIGSACYVAAWQILYRNFMPDFADKYIAHTLGKMRESGASAEEIARETQKMETFKEYYKNPIISSAITLVEPFTIGIPMTLISAAILRKRRKKHGEGSQQLEHSAA